MALDAAGGQTSPSTDKLIDLGDVLQHLGDLPNARKNYESALTLARNGGDKSMAAYALTGLGTVELEAANFLQAHKDYDEALALRNELGEKDTVSATQLAMAELAFEEGHFPEAEGLAAQARDSFQKAQKNDDQVNAIAVLAAAQFSEGKKDEAVKELQKAASIAARTQNLSVQLAIAISQARPKTTSREFGTATRSFRRH